MEYLTLIFESSRIFSGNGECVILHPENAEKYEELCRSAEYYSFRAVEAYISGGLGLNELKLAVDRVENELRCRTGKLVAGDAVFELIPHIFLVNRIVCSGKVELIPEVQIYACPAPASENDINDIKIKRVKNVEKTLEKIRKAEIKAIKTGKTDYVSRINELEGSMLGYPDCCVKEFSRRKKLRNSGKRVKSLEGEIAEEYLKQGLHRILERAFRDGIEKVEGSIPKTLFALNFYPCSLSCRKAEKVGEECKSFLEEKKYKYLFEAGVLAAMCDIETICVKMGKIKGRDYIYLSPEAVISRFTEL